MLSDRDALAAIFADERYQANLDWGAARAGHPEGTIRAHIEELEQNLDALNDKLSDTDRGRLRFAIHTHDTFKPDAEPGVAISDPRSHASIARQFLAEFCDDADLLETVQLHDEPYALWQQHRDRGRVNQERFDALLGRIEDWDLYLAFQIIDGCTVGKSREPLMWFFAQIEGRVTSRFSVGDLL